MRYGIITDVHGSDLGRIEAEFKARKIDQGICLGDFDRAHIARQMLEMQTKGDMPWAVVPGNHDYSHINREEIFSGTMTRQGIDSQMMWEEWEKPENRDVREYVQGMLDSKSKIENAARRIRLSLENDSNHEVVVMHGAYEGTYVWKPADLWNRLESEADHYKNFEAMEKKGYSMMIRGHDHAPEYTYKDPEKGIVSYSGGNSEKFRLFKRRTHTINPGAYFNGNFAIIDTDAPGEDCPIVEYHKL
ncbi:MAG: metallophosphoesterase family protein [Candidatus Aenigmatarchaeota archaeon]